MATDWTEWTEPKLPGVDVTTVTSAKKLYLYNVDADAFATFQMDWNTQAVATKLHKGEKAASANQLGYLTDVGDGKLRWHLSANGDVRFYVADATKANQVWVDGAITYETTYFSYEALGDSMYRISCDGHPLDVSWQEGGHITTAGGAGMTRWAFIPENMITGGKYAAYKARKQLYAIYQAVVASGKAADYAEALDQAYATYSNAYATKLTLDKAAKTLLTTVQDVAGSRLDVSFLFDNANLNYEFNTSTTQTKWHMAKAVTAADYSLMEQYHRSSAITMWQEQEVPKGYYTVVLHALWRQDGSGEAPYLQVASAGNSRKVDLPLMTTMDFQVTNAQGSNDWVSDGDYYRPNMLVSAAAAITHDEAVARIENFAVEDGKLKITIDGTGYATQWIVMQGVEIIYQGSFVSSLTEAIDKAKSLYDSPMNASVLADLKRAADSGQQVADGESTMAEIQDAVTLLGEAIAAAKESVRHYEATKTALDTYSAKVSLLDSYGKASWNEGIADILSAYNDRSLAADKSEEVCRIYLQAVKSQGVGADMTDAISNAGFDGGTTEGWTGAESVKIGHGCVEFYDTGTYDMYQTITGLKSGKYSVCVNGFYRNGSLSSAASARKGGTEALNTMLYANFTEQPLRSIFDKDHTLQVYSDDQTTDYGYVPNSLTGFSEWCRLHPECYRNELIVTVTDGTLRLGVRKSVAASTDWSPFDSFSLCYLGESASDYEATLLSVLSSAKAVDATAAMNADVRADLAASIENGQHIYDTPSHTLAELREAVVWLERAINTAEASIETYGRLASILDYVTERAGSLHQSGKSRFDTDMAAINTNYTEGLYADDDILPAVIPAALHTLADAALAQTGDDADLSYAIIDNSFELYKLLSTDYLAWTYNPTGDTQPHSNLSPYTVDKGEFEGNCLFNTWETDDGNYYVHQSIHLPAGTYRLQAMYASDAGNSAYLYAGGMRSGTKSGVDKTDGVTASLLLRLDEEQDVELGIKSGKWFKADNFRLARVPDGSLGTDLTDFVSNADCTNGYFSGTKEYGEPWESPDGWTASNTASGYGDAASWHVNAWSWEGDTDGTYMKVPFIEYYQSSTALKNNTLTHDPVTGLTPGWYRLSVLIRNVGVNDRNTALKGITLFANDATVDVTKGTQHDSGTFGTYSLDAYVGQDGILTFGFTIQSANIRWLAIKNFCLTYMGDSPLENHNLENPVVHDFLANVNYTRSDMTKVGPYIGQVVNYRKDQPAGYTLSWTAEGATKITVSSEGLEVSETHYFSNAPQSYVFYNLIPQQTYTYTVYAGTDELESGTFTPEGQVRMLKVESLFNVRDLGGRQTSFGKPVRYGLIYRGCELNNGNTVSAAGIKTLLSLGIGAELDLRTDDQAANITASPIGTFVKYLRSPATNGYYTQLVANPDAWRDDIRFITENLRQNRPVYFHCQIGADRTGTVAFLLEGLAGVAYSDMVKDFELTSFSANGDIRNKAEGEDWGFDTMYDYIVNNNQGADDAERFYNYLLSIGLTTTELDALRGIMLGDEEMGVEAVSQQVAGSKEQVAGSIYDLTGRRVSGLSGTSRTSGTTGNSGTAGVYIINGRKTFLRQ